MVKAAAPKSDHTALDAKHDEKFRSGGSNAPKCLRIYLVLGRLFKLHPDFDVAIAGILAGDPSGCVVLIHETQHEEWTRTVWNRLREVLLPQGIKALDALIEEPVLTSDGAVKKDHIVVKG